MYRCTACVILTYNVHVHYSHTCMYNLQCMHMNGNAYTQSCQWFSKKKLTTLYMQGYRILKTYLFILKSLFLLLQKAQSGEVEAELTQLYVNASRRSRDAIAEQFNLQTPLYFSYTHLVCRTAKEGAIPLHLYVYTVCMCCTLQDLLPRKLHVHVSLKSCLEKLLYKSPII